MVRTDLIKLIAAEWTDLPPSDVDKIVAESSMLLRHIWQKADVSRYAASGSSPLARVMLVLGVILAVARPFK